MSEERTFDQMAGRLFGEPVVPGGFIDSKPPAPADSRGLLPADDRLQTMAEKFYGKELPGLERVDFDEPQQGTHNALGATQRLPHDVVTTPADQAELVQVQQTWHALGFGLTQSQALWDATLAARRHAFSADEGKAELVKMYGAAAASKVADAGRLFAEMRRAWPNAEGWIRKVGNDPRVVAVFAERQARRSK